VSDVWRPLPLRDARVDVVLCVFAPRNAAEFARVLRPGGRLIVVTPAERHLVQLRDGGLVIGLQPDKLGHLDATLDAEFALVDRAALEYDAELSGRDIRSLVAMGPSGHHAAFLADETADSTVTVAVDVSTYSVR
jgi:23S rRNA (guanine745-N1)-methyltransferase